MLANDIVDYCNKFKMCRGCHINCVAPTSDRDFYGWLSSQIQRIRDHEKLKEAMKR